MLRRDRAALEDVIQAVPNGIGICDRLRRYDRQTVGALDHFAECAPLEKADLTELLSAHLFIGSALQLFGAGLVDDVGHLMLGELATELLLPGFDGHVPLLRPLREPFEQLRLDTFNLESTGSLPGLVAKLMQPFGQFIAIDSGAVIERAEYI